MTELYRWHLRHISRDAVSELQFNRGINIIYGSAGSGKSELAHLIAGLEHSKQSNWVLDGLDANIQSQIVIQNPDLQILFPTVGEELSFNIECRIRDTGQIHEERDKLFELPFMLKDPARHPVSLSGGEKEILNIVSALSSDPDLLVIDDSLSFLNKDLKTEIIEHLEDWSIVNQRTILWFTSDITDLGYSNNKWIVEHGLVSEYESDGNVRYQDITIPNGALTLDVKDLNFGYDDEIIFKDFTFYSEGVRSIGISGKNGSGKTTLASLLTGILKPGSGTIKLSVDGVSEIRTGYMDQFPERVMGLKTPEEFLNLLVQNDLFLASKKDVLINSLKQFNLDWDAVKNTPANELPWTTTRLVLNFITACGEYDVLILDEPTFGLGWEQKCRLLDYYVEYLKNKYLIIISHDYDFIEKICNVSCVVERKSFN